MDAQDENALIRRLPRYLLGLLDDTEREEVEVLLARSESARDALAQLRDQARQPLDDGTHLTESELQQLAAGDAEADRARALLAHLLECRECRFDLSIVLAADVEDTRDGRPSQVAPPSPMQFGGTPRRFWSPVGFATAATVVLAVGLTGWYVGTRSTPHGDTSVGAVRVDLSAVRGEASDIVFEVVDIPDEGLVLVVETVMAAAEIDWRLMVDGERELLGGSVRFAPGAQTLRHFVVPVDKADLVPGNYDLVLTASDGHGERQYRFRVWD